MGDLEIKIGSTASVFDNLLKYEILARDMYTDVIDADPVVLKEFLPDDGERSEFIYDIENIINDEKKHISICERMMPGFTDISWITDE